MAKRWSPKPKLRVRISPALPNNRKRKNRVNSWMEYYYSPERHLWLYQHKLDCSHFHKPRFDPTNTKWGPNLHLE